MGSGDGKVEAAGLIASKGNSSSGQITLQASSTRRSERLEKRAAPETPETPPVPRKSKRLEQQSPSTPSPLRRSDRCKAKEGSKSSEKVSASVDTQKKKEKKEKSVEQLTMESVKVSLDENYDIEAFSLKKKKMTARRYKAIFTKPRKLSPLEGSDDKLERDNLLPGIDSLANGSEPLEHQENSSLGRGLMEIEPSLVGAPGVSDPSLKDWNEKSSISNDPKFADSGKSLSDKPPISSDRAELYGSLKGGTNSEIDDVNKHINDQLANKKLKTPELRASAPRQKGDISLESGEQVLQSERESLQVDVSRNVVNKDSSTEVVEAVSSALGATEVDDDNFNGNSAVCSKSNLVEVKENFIVHGNKPDSSKFVEYWVPIPVSNLQLEQYCATLLTHATTLYSPLKRDDMGVLQDILMSVRKCCNHPYLADSSLQSSITTGLPGNEIMNFGIKASGKLELLDMILSKIREQKLRVVILLQTIAGSGKISTGDILDDFLRYRFGSDSYERIDACLSPAKRQDAINRFNKGGENFVLLLEHRACSSSIKLFAVDIVIIFDTENNPANDIKDLQRMSINSQSGQIKVFRLYSCYTFEEKVLTRVKHHKNVQNSLQIAVRRTIGDSLLMWGAPVLFNRLDKYHAEESTVSSLDISSGQQWLLNDVVKNFMDKINNSEKNYEQNSIISRAFISEGVYHTDCLLLGEKEVELADGEDHQIFWKKLLEGRNPRWKFLGLPTSRSRKRVLNDENNETSSKHQKTDTRDTASTFQSELEERGQAAVSKSACKPVPSPCTVDMGDKVTNCVPRGYSSSNGSDSAHLEVITPSDEQRDLHLLLRAEMEKLCDALGLSMDIKQMVGTFLEYVMENHHVNKEPASILQAFQISLCWIAASILKEKIDKGDSLTLAKEVLKYQCSEEEACSVYVKLRSMKKKFMQLPRNNVSPSPQDVESASESGRKKPPYAGHASSVPLDLHIVTVPGEERSSSLEPSEEQTIDEVNGSCANRKIKKLQRKCDKRMFQLHQQHEEEILKFHKMKEQEKLQLEGDYQLESAFVRTTYPENIMRMDQLKLLEDSFKKKMLELENLMEAHFKALQARHSAEIEEKKKMVDDWMAEKMSCITSSGHEKEVSTANPDIGKQNPDGIVAGNVTSSNISVTIADSADDGVACSEPLCHPVTQVPDEVLENKRASVQSVIVAEQPEETFERSHQIQTTAAQEADGCVLDTEALPPLLNSTSGMELDTVIQTSPAATAEQQKEVTPHITQGITLNSGSHGIDGTSIDLAMCEEQNSCEISSSSQLNARPSVVHVTVASEIGKASTLEVDTSLQVETGDGGGNSMGCDSMGNQIDNTHNSPSETVPSQQLPPAYFISSPVIPSPESPDKHVCDDSGQQASDCSSPDCNSAEAVPHGHIEGCNFLPTSAASLQTDEAVSGNGEPLELPPSSEGVDVENSLRASAASLQINEGSVERAHVAVSCDAEPEVLSPPSEGVGLDQGNNLFDVEIVNGADGGPNIELPAMSQDTVVPPTEPSTNIRPQTQVELQLESNLAVPERVAHFPGNETHYVGYRNPTLSLPAEPLLIELNTINKDLEQMAKFFESAKSVLKSECEKEIEETVAQIRQKYEAKLKEAESAFLLKKTQLDLNRKTVLMNKLLAEAFQSKCLDIRTSGNSAPKQAAPSSFTQQMHQLSLQPRLRQPSPSTAALSSGGQPANIQQIASSSLQSLRHSSGPFASLPARPPQISAIATPARPPQITAVTPSVGSLRVGGEIRAQAPHLQPFRPPASMSAASLSSLPCNLPSQQLPANIPATSLSPPSILAQQPLPSLPSQSFPKPNCQSQTPSVSPHNRTDQDVSCNQPSETQNGVQPGHLNLLSAVELLMDIDDQAGVHLPNISQHFSGSGLNAFVLDTPATRATSNVNKGVTTSATASDVVCLSDDDS